MRAIWFAIRWVVRQAVFLVTLVTVALLVLLLPMSLTTYMKEEINRWPYQVFEPSVDKYKAALQTHFDHLLDGSLVPPLDSLALNSPLRFLDKSIINALPVTLNLLGVTLVTSLAVGIPLGFLLSTLAPRRARTPLWGLTTLLASIPDLLLASILALSLVMIALATGTGPIRGSEGWQHFWAPVIALTLVVAPYVARVTATAADEITGHLYIRAAVAKGVHPRLIALKHVGKNVMVRVSSILPVVVSLLFSSGAVVEYMMEVPGLGRLMLINMAPKVVDRYPGVAYLIPMLLFFSITLGFSDLIQRWLDPRIRGAEAPSARVKRLTRAELRTAWRESRLWLERSLPIARTLLITFLDTLPDHLAAFGQWLDWLNSQPRGPLFGLLNWLRTWLRPYVTFVVRRVLFWVDILWDLALALVRNVRAMRNPWVTTGSLLVLGLVLVAIFGPWLAPYDPTEAQSIKFYGMKIGMPPFAPDFDHLLGTDELGRDLLSQIIYGTRYALLFALLIAPARFVLAMPFGLLAAYRGGGWERLIRWFATFFTAVPQVALPLALVPFVNKIYRQEPLMMLLWSILLIALPGVPRLADSIRSQAVEIVALPFVEGAKAVGAGLLRTIFRYVVPPMLPQLMTMLTLEIPSVLTLTALLSYFQAYPGGTIWDTERWIPVAPLIPEWGSVMSPPLLLLMSGQWWRWAPYFALFVAVLSFNILGEGMRRVLVSRTGWKWQADR